MHPLSDGRGFVVVGVAAMVRVTPAETVAVDVRAIVGLAVAVSGAVAVPGGVPGPGPVAGQRARRLIQISSPMPATPIVGKNVDSWCTRCKLILAHTIESVVSGRITRVHCNTCGGQHAYRARPPGETGARSARPRGDGARAATKAVRDYASLLRARDPSTARAYAVTERFKDGELIRHPTFGLGLVTALKDVNKIEVMFADGSKTLIHRH